MTGPAFETVVGLEVHLRLTTATKLFCSCAMAEDVAPNTRVCPVCLGLPGSLPVLNAVAVARALRLAAAVGADVSPTSVFGRKQYVYPDLPRNYQITQLDPPLARGGALGIDVDGRCVPLQRMHLEEDAARLDHHRSDATGVDFDRAGAPLLEIVTGPDLRSGDEAETFLRELARLARWLDVSGARMERGELRCDANISMRSRGDRGLGARVELKNLNSPRHVRRAVEHEAARQGERLARGAAVAEETRGWDATGGRTVILRHKEDAPAYRYLPEPDLPPLVLSEKEMETAEAMLTELPHACERRFVRDLGLEPGTASLLAVTRARADLLEAVIAEGAEPGSAAKLIVGAAAAVANERGVAVEALPWRACDLAELLALIASGELLPERTVAVLARLLEGEATAGAVVDAAGWRAVCDADADLTALVDSVLAAHPEQVSSCREGRPTLIGWFVGRVLAEAVGEVDPRRVRALVEQRLGEGGDPI